MSSTDLDDNEDYKTVASTIEATDWEHDQMTDHINPLLVLSNIDQSRPFRNILYRGVDNGI